MNILLAVTGSISAYRALDICRSLTKNSHSVKVILTKGATEFVKPEVFKYLGAEAIFSFADDFNTHVYESNNKVLHIDLVKWCDRLVIAPASANTIAKLANGICDDLLSSIFLAIGIKPVLIFPAMNSNMLEHPMTQANLQKLQSLNNIFIHPTESGELACGDEGFGKLPKPELIAEVIPLINLSTPKRTVLITTGATISPLDPVRYITNPSSGTTGYEFAKSYLANGDKVILVCGHNTTTQIENLRHLPNMIILQTNTTRQMQEAVLEHFETSDIYISSAALSDLEFEVSEKKLKKSDLNQSLSFQTAPDVLKSVLERKKHQIVIGFAAETDTSESIFKEKWNRKPVDLLIGNLVNSGASSSKIGFGQDRNEYFFIKEGNIISKAVLTKSQLADKIVKEIY